MAKDDNILTLEYDGGVEVECEIIGVFECDGKEYMAVAELNEAGDDYTGDVFIYGYKEDGEDYELFDITDENEFQKAVAELDRITMEEEQTSDVTW